MHVPILNLLIDGIHCSLKNHRLDKEVDSMFDLSTEMFVLPLEERMPYHYQQEFSSFG